MPGSEAGGALGSFRNLGWRATRDVWEGPSSFRQGKRAGMRSSYVMAILEKYPARGTSTAAPNGSTESPKPFWSPPSGG
jgi:hypothetical protein